MIAPGVTFGLDADIFLGRNVSLSPGVVLYTATHPIGFGSQRMLPYTDPKPIVIEDGVWLCAHCRIVLGITIAEDCVIQMGAVLERSTEPSGIYQGVPAKRIGERKIRDYPGPKREEARPVAVAS